jgi:pyruvate dehydrogenase E1 component alpha subunit
MIGKGIDPKTYLAEHCGRATGCAGGLGGVHACYDDLGIMGAGGTLGSGFSVSVGWGLAAQMNGTEQVVVCFFGDGTSNRGTWHEAANMAALWKLPIVWVCENNGIAQYVPVESAYPLKDLANMASAYGTPSVVVDGQDVVAVAEAVGEAVKRARKGKGPSFVECKTARFGPHGIGNPDSIHGKPRDPKEIEKLKKRDAIELFRKRLLEQGTLTKKMVAKIEADAVVEVEQALEFIEESPYPEDPAILNDALYAE